MLIELQTTAFTTVISLNKGATLQLIGDVGASVVTLEQPDGSGGWIQAKISGDVVSLTSDNTMLSITAPVMIRVNKPVTTNPAGVMVVS